MIDVSGWRKRQIEERKPRWKEWRGLTEEEIDQICGDVGYGYMDVAKAIEAKLKEKNT